MTPTAACAISDFCGVPQVHDAVAEGYSTWVPCGMCLQLVRERLVNHFYRSVAAIQNDISTILANCCEYNDPQSFIVTCARRLVKQINRELVERWAVVDEHANGDWDDEDLPDDCLLYTSPSPRD